MSLRAGRDVALETLLLPFSLGQLSWPAQGAVFLRARAGATLQASQFPGLVCEQSFKPEADALERAGFPVRDVGDEKYPLVMVLPPRQRDESRALLARAVSLTQPGGLIVVAQANDEGARSTQTDVQRLVGPCEVFNKHRCRAFWAVVAEATTDTALVAQWRDLDAPRPIADGRFVSRPGLFAWDRIDPASEALVRHLPTDLVGRAADLGSGFGYLSVELLARCPRITSLDMYEAERRALDLSRDNLQQASANVTLDFLWHDVCAGLSRSYDVIVTNPPFHAQRGVDRPDLGQRFIEVAAAALRPGGRLYLVANRHLPYESALNAGFAKMQIVGEEHGFKIIEAVRATVTRRRK